MARGFLYASLSGSSKDEGRDTHLTPDESRYSSFRSLSDLTTKTRVEISEPKTFDPNKQTWRLFREQALRLVFTVLLVAGTIVALTVYEREDTVSHKGKITFNAVITILNLALGLNFLVSTTIGLAGQTALIIRYNRKHSRIWRKSFVGGCLRTGNSPFDVQTWCLEVRA